MSTAIKKVSKAKVAKVVPAHRPFKTAAMKKKKVCAIRVVSSKAVKRRKNPFWDESDSTFFEPHFDPLLAIES